MMSSCENESGTGVPIPSSSTNPDKGQHIECVLTNKGVREFLVIEHTANLRNNTKISAIWYHGDERRRLAMATQCEQVFSAVRRTLTPGRDALGLKVLEACECLRWCWRSGVVSGKAAVVPMTPRAHIEAHIVTNLLGGLWEDVE
jgi:hypothetical protein